MKKNQIKYVDNVLLNKDLFKLYKNLIACNSWNLARTSSGGELGTFPGFVVRDNYTNVFNNYWDGYFNCLYERIKIKFYEKYNYELTGDIFRIHLGAKNNMSKTTFHKDDKNSEATTIVGFLTPAWSEGWGGALQVEETKINFKPGLFSIFDSNQIHDGEGPNKQIPYWRISINYVIKDYGQENI
tara:strand:+ start:270 stop:824 length:555 start_codon:yes stop_codon:yes gene_type:complete